MRTTAHRRHYATKFNTFDENVRYWDELSEQQQQQAGATFNCWVDMAQFAYQVGNNGWVVSRRRLLPGDEPYNKSLVRTADASLSNEAMSDAKD